MLTRYIRKNTGGVYSKTGVMIRKPSRTKKGIMIAVPVDYDKIRVGWSLCNFSMEDEFSDLGMKIAIERAETSSTLLPAHSMIADLKEFIERVRTYYKDKKVEITFPLAEAPDSFGDLAESSDSLGNILTANLHE